MFSSSALFVHVLLLLVVASWSWSWGTRHHDVLGRSGRRWRSYLGMINGADGGSSSQMPASLQSAWLEDANMIEYVVGQQAASFSSLSSLGLNISSELSSRNIIPHHLTSSSDLFCNRELNMEQIEAIGFDMDWTLAQYNEDFDLLAYNGAKEKLVQLFGYPKEILTAFTYKQTFCRRGCIIDRKRGNIIKLDQHNYVRTAEHGLTPLTSEERKTIYRENYLEVQTFTASNFVNIDTPFSLVDATLFAQLVDFRDNSPFATKGVLATKSYNDLWLDMRKCVDRCHKDGVIKDTVALDPKKYITYDPNIFPMLDSFRRAGKRTFLLTNSLWEYTQVVMNYLEGKKDGDNKDLAWTDYFDIIIVGGNKPAFLVDEVGALPLFRINIAGTDTTTPSTTTTATTAPVHSKSANSVGITMQNVEDAMPRNEAEAKAFLQVGKCFQGGNAQMLHKLLHIPAGDRLLYVGDHMYADVLRSKRTLGWRTCLILPELTAEIKMHRMQRDVRNKLAEMRKQQFELEHQLDNMHLVQAHGSLNEEVDHEVNALKAEAAHKLSERLSLVRKEMLALLASYNDAYHPKWGQLFKAGFQESRFAKQIVDYACMYTSRASNLGLVSPQRPFRPVRDRLPHDFFLESHMRSLKPQEEM